ncbi:MAG: HDOD domain-containing protein [Planctomycetes bacterium]|nr:HDOD domain-containing protein [Planctomycetota bacterium]MBL7145393.1 HDOD domain-containing protein [Phycisphaerae bacterium]
MESQKDFEDKVTEFIHRLPPMPGNVSELLNATNVQEMDDEELLAYVKQDPGLCADLLHLANTFSIRAEGHDDTIEEAVNSVGIKPLIQLIGVWYARNIIAKEFDMLDHLDDYFKHSQEISLACRTMSEILEADEHDCQVAYVAGLIHDMGRLAIILLSNRVTAPLLGTPCAMMNTIVDQEQKLVGMDHCRVGMQLCKKWNFSELLQQAILRHHSPLIDSDFDYLGAVIFTCHFISCSDFTGETLAAMLPGELLNRLKLTPESFVKTQQIYFARMAEN